MDMNDFLNYIGLIGADDLQMIVSGLIKILLAAFCGALVGTERGRKHRPAGLRTHMLVCVAAALVMATNEQLINAYGTGDPSRMGAQVISGIGFLGAGTILTDRQNRIRGLTTAAGLWASACVGLAIGSGYYIGGLCACFLMLLIFTKFIGIEQHIVRKSRMMELDVTFENSKSLNGFISEVTGYDCNLVSFTLMGKGGNETEKTIKANLLIWLPVNREHDEIMQILTRCKGLLYIREIS